MVTASPLVVGVALLRQPRLKTAAVVVFASLAPVAVVALAVMTKEA